MNNTDVNRWANANQRYLMACLAEVRARLQHYTAGNEDTRVSVEPELEEARATLDGIPAPAALDTLCAAFGLSRFERAVLLLCAGIELESSFGSLCALAQGQEQHTSPTFSLALAALPDAHWSALAPAAPLRYWRLIDVAQGEALTTSALRIDERVLHYLTGIAGPDERLVGVTELQPPPDDLPPSQRATAERIAGIWNQTEPETFPVIHLAGEDGAAKRAAAAFACAALGMELRVVRGADIPANAAEREALSILCQREAVLDHTALFVDCDEGENQRVAFSFADRTRGCVLVGSREPVRLRLRPLARLDVTRATAAEQRRLWQTALGPLTGQLNGELETLVSQFDMGMDDIASA